MLYDHYIEIVQDRAGIKTTEVAEQAIHAVFAVLDEAIPRSLAEELAETIPAEIRGRMGRSIWTLRFNRDEFTERVAEKEGVDKRCAERHARAVLSVLGEYLPSIELLKTLDQLTKDVRTLFKTCCLVPEQA